MSKTFIVIPAYNEEKTIVEVIKGLKSKGYTNLVVVDDGSKDNTKILAEKEKAILLLGGMDYLVMNL